MVILLVQFSSAHLEIKEVYKEAQWALTLNSPLSLEQRPSRINMALWWKRVPRSWLFQRHLTLTPKSALMREVWVRTRDRTLSKDLNRRIASLLAFYPIGAHIICKWRGILGRIHYARWEIILMPWEIRGEMRKSLKRMKRCAMVKVKRMKNPLYYRSLLSNTTLRTYIRLHRTKFKRLSLIRHLVEPYTQ